MLQLNLDGKIRDGNLGLKFLPEMKRAPAFGRQAILRPLQFGMLEKIELQRQPGPQGRPHREDGFHPLLEGSRPEFGMDELLQVANPFPDRRIGTQQFSRQKNRIRVTQFPGEIFSLLAQPRIRRILELEVAEKTGFEDAINARTQPLKILLKTPGLQIFDLFR